MYFQLKEMEKKLVEYRKGDIPASPASSGKYDGMYSTTNGSVSFSEDAVVHRPAKSRTVAHRLSRSFRERNLLKPHRVIDSGKSPRSDKNTSVISESGFEDSRSYLQESHTDESRLADTSLDITGSSEESYKISNDSLYPTSYLPVDSHLDMSFLTPPIAPKRREAKCMSPNTRRSKRASWHHTMFQKLSPQIPRANKETAV